MHELGVLCEVVRIVEEINANLINTKPLLGKNVINTHSDQVFIRTSVLEQWFKNEQWIKNPAEVIRNLARIGMLPNVDPDMKRYPPRDRAGLKRRSGILWNCQGEGEIRVIGTDKNKAIEIIEG